MSIEVIISIIAVLGVGGILGALLNRRFEQQKQTNEHDKDIFIKSDEILTEQKLFNILNDQLINFHSITREDNSVLEKWCNFIEQTGKRYLDKSINNKCQKLLKDLRELTKFTRKNFDFWKRVENPLYLKPELDPDKAINDEDVTRKQVDQYNSYATELTLLTRNSKKHYSEYRLAVKNKLKI